MNLLDVIKDQFSGEIIGKLGSAIGESPEKTQSAIGASIPAILGGLLKIASTSAGAGAGTIQRHADPADLPSIGDLGSLFSGDTSALLKTGLAMLTALFGESATGVIVASLSKYAGINPESAKKLLGYLLPIILSTIASKAGGLNAQSFANMIAGQKDNIANALPSGFSLPNIQSLAVTELPAAAGMPKWLLVLVGLVAIAGLAFFFRPTAEPEGVEDTAIIDTPTKVAPIADFPPGIEIPKVEIPDAVAVGKDYTSLFSTLTDALSGVKDAPTAEAAVAKLKESDTKLDALKVLFDKIPAASRAKIVEGIRTGLEPLKKQTIKVLALPAVSEKLKPIIDEILKKLGGLSG